MKSNGCVALLNILYTNLQQCNYLRQWVDIISPFSPFDIKCKRRIVKNLWKLFLEHPGE